MLAAHLAFGVLLALAATAVGCWIFMLRSDVAYWMRSADRWRETLDAERKDGAGLRSNLDIAIDRLAARDREVAALESELAAAKAEAARVSSEFVDCFEAYDDVSERYGLLLEFVARVRDGADDILEAQGDDCPGCPGCDGGRGPDDDDDGTMTIHLDPSDN